MNLDPQNDGPAGNTLSQAPADGAFDMAVATTITSGLVTEGRFAYFGGTDGSGDALFVYEVGVDVNSDANAFGQRLRLASPAGPLRAVPKATIRAATLPTDVFFGTDAAAGFGSFGLVSFIPVNPDGTIVSSTTRSTNGSLDDWLTGAFGRVFSGSNGGASTELYSQNDANVSLDVTGFPYPTINAAGTPVSDFTHGVSVSFPTLRDEVFGGDSGGRLHCVLNPPSFVAGFPADMGKRCSAGYPFVVDTIAGQIRGNLIGTLIGGSSRPDFGIVTTSNGRVFRVDYFDATDNPVRDDTEGFPYSFGADLTLPASGGMAFLGTPFDLVNVATVDGRVYFLKRFPTGSFDPPGDPSEFPDPSEIFVQRLQEGSF